jgi:hypothetical protein
MGQSKHPRVKDHARRVAVPEPQNDARRLVLHGRSKAQSRVFGNGELGSAGLTLRAPKRIFATLERSPVQLVTRRRSARHAARRRQRAFRALLWCGVGITCLAFAAGFALTSDMSGESLASGEKEINTAQRAESLRLLDQAVQAKFGELWNEAARLAFEARQTDEETPRLDIFIGELAFEKGEIDAVGSAARAALLREPMSADAKLLLALRAWALRGQTGVAQAGASATALLQQAAADELSNGVVRFFAGDFQRAIGRPGDAHVELLGGLYRQHVWHSAALLTAKLFLALEEAGPSGSLASSVFIDPEVEAFGTSATALRRTIRNSGNIVPASTSSTDNFSAKQLRVLSSDQAFASAPGTFAGSGPISPPPFGGISAFDSAPN